MNALRYCSGLAFGCAVLAHVLSAFTPYSFIAVLALAAFAFLMGSWIGVTYLWAVYSCRFTGHVRSIYFLLPVWRALRKRGLLFWMLLSAYPIVLAVAFNRGNQVGSPEFRDGTYVLVDYSDRGHRHVLRDISEVEFISLRQSQISFGTACLIPFNAMPALFVFFVYPGLRKQYVATLPDDSLTGANQRNYSGI